MKMNELTTEDYEKIISMNFDALSWMAVLGNVILALRHPENTGASRALVLKIVKQMENNLMLFGIMDQEDVDFMHKSENQAKWFEIGRN